MTYKFLKPFIRKFVLCFLLTPCLIIIAPLKSYCGEILDPKFCDTFYGLKERIYLHGMWKFKMVPGKDGYDHTDQGTLEKFYQADYNDADWKDQVVPEKIKVIVKNERNDPPGIAYYRKKFDIPAKHKDKRIILYFQEVSYEPIVWINGQEVARPQNYCIGVSSDEHYIDITDAVKIGAENQITVRTYCYQFTSPDRYYMMNNGIFAPVWLDIRPNIYVENARMTPELPDKISIECKIINTYKTKQKVTIKASAEPWEGDADYAKRISGKGKSTISTIDLGPKELIPGLNELKFSLTIKEPVQWDIFNPFLYGFKILINNEEAYFDRFGLREFKVAGRNFYLNGKPIKLLGVNMWEGTALGTMHYLVYNNLNDFLRKFLTTLREENINILARWHCMPRILLDICDEIGMFRYEEFDYSNRCTLIGLDGLPYTRIYGIPENRKVYHDKLWNTDTMYTLVDRVVKKRIAMDYNHPSLIARSISTELIHKPYFQIDPLVDIIRKYDNSRPVAAGGSYLFETADAGGKPIPIVNPPKMDFVDYHGWPIGHDQWDSYMEIPDKLKEAESGIIKRFGYLKPLVDNEALEYRNVKYDTWHWVRFTKSYYSPIIREDGTINITKYCDLMGTESPQKWHFRTDIKHAGIRVYFDKPKMWEYISDMHRRMIELVRMNGERCQGIGGCSQPEMLYKDYSMEGFAKCDPANIIGYGPMGQGYKDCYAPVLICADIYNKHNLFAGMPKIINIYSINESWNDLAGLSIEVNITGQTGASSYYQDRIELGALPQAATKTNKYEIKVPANIASGNYFLTMSLKQGALSLSENKYRIYVLGIKERDIKITSSKKIAVYDKVGSIFAGMGVKSTIEILDKFGITYESIKDFSNLDKHEVLIIGANSIDTPVLNGGEKIRDWIEAGGRLICFEQMYKGPLPFLTEARYVGQNTANSRICDIIEQKHPACSGLTQFQNFDGWNDRFGVIYNSYIQPLSECVVLSGPNHPYGDAEAVWGMLAADIAVGKGKCFLSQVETTQKYGDDSVATRYINNLLTYTLQDNWAGEYSGKIRGQRQKVNIIPEEKTEFIDLRPYCNMGFMDNVAGDSKGGWDDTGPDNDFRDFPVGKQMFSMVGVTFDIIDPLKNDNKSVSSHKVNF